MAARLRDAALPQVLGALVGQVAPLVQAERLGDPALRALLLRIEDQARERRASFDPAFGFRDQTGALPRFSSAADGPVEGVARAFARETARWWASESLSRWWSVPLPASLREVLASLLGSAGTPVELLDRTPLEPGHESCAVCRALLAEREEERSVAHLPALASFGAAPEQGWMRAAQSTVNDVVEILAGLRPQEAPWLVPPALASAWRQLAFFNSRLDEGGRRVLAAWTRTRALHAPPPVRERVDELFLALAAPEANPPLRGTSPWAERHLPAPERAAHLARVVFCDDPEEWDRTARVLSVLDARRLLALDTGARTSRQEDPAPLGAPERWAALDLDEPTGLRAAVASLHPDGYLRERAVRHLGRAPAALAARFLALRLLDHVPQVRESAWVAVEAFAGTQHTHATLEVLHAAAARRVAAGSLDRARTLLLPTATDPGPA